MKEIIMDNIRNQKVASVREPKKWKSQQKLRMISWAFCGLLNVLLYALEGNGFSVMLSGLNVFVFVVFTFCITETFLLIHKRVAKNSKKLLDVVLSSASGILIGIGIALAILFTSFGLMMYLIYAFS